MIAYTWPPEDARTRARKGSVRIHRIEGEPLEAAVSDDKAMREGTWKRCCDGGQIALSHVKRRDIKRAPAGLEVCTVCFKGHYDELIPLYRTIPTGWTSAEIEESK